LKLDLKGRDPDDGMNDIAYEKGKSLILLIEKTVGREKLDQFLRNYFKKHAFKTITTEEFVEEVKTELFKNDTNLLNKVKLEDWIYKPGLPDNYIRIESVKFNEAEKRAKEFSSGKKASELGIKSYSTNEWLRFLRSLPQNMSQSQMQDLDQTFQFDRSGNSEIVFEWLMHVVGSSYAPSYPKLRSFLTEVGRRKFVKPLFTEMLKSNDGKKMAKEIYSTARNNYHSVTKQTIDQLIDKNSP
jgi:leukotriene-A4 hydrolase